MSTPFAKTAVPTESEILATPIPKRVDRGVRLQRIVKRASEELEKLKGIFRIEADSVRLSAPGLSPVTFIGGIGTTKITYKGDSLKVKKGAMPLTLKDSLPASVFYNLFDVETVASPCKDFKDKLARLPADQKALIMQHFEMVPNTPAVEFSK